jgi:hypothetical protein
VKFDNLLSRVRCEQSRRTVPSPVGRLISCTRIQEIIGSRLIGLIGANAVTKDTPACA